MLMKIRHMPVLAFVQTGIMDGEPIGVVLVEQKPGKEWVTAIYKVGQSEWCYGNYWFNKEEAQRDFLKRAEEKLGLAIKPPAPVTMTPGDWGLAAGHG